MFQKLLLTLPLILSLSFTDYVPTSFAENDRQVDSPHYLRLLNRTTGRSVGEAGFQARVDSMFTTTATPTRSLVQKQDAQARKVEASLAFPEEKLVVSGVTQEDFNRFGEEEEEEESDLTDLNQPISSKIDGTDKAYQAETIAIFKEVDKRKKEASARTSEFDEESTQEVISASSETLPNNPYYFKPAATLQDNRNIIVNRLMLSGNMEYDEALDLLIGVNSQEELIIELMEEEGFTYGQANNLLTFEE